jgi:signal transduction histidine kinase/CheY-like chemotaxis protein/HPt (histidine-containing phosphotransfer) domain-containing protein
MSLQRKIVLVLLILGAAFAVGSYTGLQSFVFPAFEDFERVSAKENLSRAKRAMNAELRAMDILSREYSEWDHTYDYVRGLRDEFAEENLYVSYWTNIDVDMMLYFDIDGKLLWGSLLDSSKTKELSFEEGLQQSIKPGHPLLQHRQDLDGVHGIVKTWSAPLLVSANPVLTSQGTGPPAGTVIVGRYLDPERIEALAKRASVDLLLYSRNDSGASEEIWNAVERGSDTEDSTYLEYRDDHLSGYELLDDIFGASSFLLEVRNPKTISEIGKNTIKAAMLFLLGATVVLLVASWLFMRRLIVAPIGNLTEHILRIRKTGDLYQQFELDRNDEIGTLASEFCQLTTELNNVQIELEMARDRALAMSKAKSEFLARMSHEIRTPMNGVLGMIELLNNTSLDNSQKRYAQTIHDSADSLLDIINDVLDFSKIEAGKLRLEKLTFDLHAFLNDMVKGLATLAHQKGLILECAVPEGPALAVRGDPFRLRQVLTNLIGNAVKFTERGSVLLRATTSADDAEHMNICFEVKDTGIGISPEKQKLIFDSFSQEDGSTTRRFGGTGLGLAISKQLVQMMGGDLCVESETGQGSVFLFTLRMRASRESEFSASARTLQRGIFKPKDRTTAIEALRGRVLLGEDNAVNQAVAEGMLSAMGVEVVVASNGEEVTEHYSAGSFDAILMDCQMPVLDGFEATERIRRIESENNQSGVPIIAVTANALVGDREKCIAAGMNDYLSKPFSGEQLYGVLSRYLTDREAKKPQDADLAPPQETLTSESGATGPALDPNVLDGLSRLQQSGPGDLVKRVIAAYLSSSTELMTKLFKAIESEDADGVRTSAHALKSSSANVGALVFSELCKMAEAAGRQEDLSRVLQIRPQIEYEYERVIAALESKSGAAAA